MQARIVFCAVAVCVMMASGLLYYTSAKPNRPPKARDDVHVVNGGEYSTAAMGRSDTREAVSAEETLGSPADTRQAGEGNLGNPGGRLLAEKSPADEERDSVWSDTTEAAIKDQASAVPYIDPATLQIDCRSTMCRASGQAKAGTSATDRKAMIVYVKNLEFTDAGSGVNAIVRHTTLREEESKLAFAIEYARIRK